MLEHALYTRPREFEGELSVPRAYISGDHKKIEQHKELNLKNEITQSVSQGSLRQRLIELVKNYLSS
jgi:tRNA G37 N-methylase TrmD